MLRKIFYPLLFAAFASLGSGLQAGNGGQLVVFLQQEDHPVTQDFRKEVLPKIEEMAQAQDIEVLVRDVSKGAPEMVTFTPSIDRKSVV